MFFNTGPMFPRIEKGSEGLFTSAVVVVAAFVAEVVDYIVVVC